MQPCANGKFNRVKSESGAGWPAVWHVVHLWTGLDSPCVVKSERFNSLHFTEVASELMIVPLWSDMLRKCPPLLSNINTSSVRVDHSWRFMAGHYRARLWLIKELLR